MRILAIDGAGPVAVAACGRGPDGPLIAGSARRAAGADADGLPLLVERCLQQASWRSGQVDLIACGIGPGGFTSIRVAVALARGLALAASLPVLAVTSFQALADRARREGVSGPLRVVVPGGRGNWFIQDFDERGHHGEPEILAAPPGVLPDRTLVGSGCEGMVELVADASDVAHVAFGRHAAGAGGSPGSELVPLYLRGADAREGAGRSLLDRVDP
ncbi:tRNA (adenosine(37)-N6)-threonylcarbamoyltransferase complex dimerization subunit type 1 TsaB [Geminicoccus roseus]|uniref:tRNA (adenosine(37)-N6)-threonylcarbamoyltransferase complex dimerization subunit type 1 TsaB n=1 Tax=Geminicoccus roseus TaxID=404900 RepID=UPI0004090780|nr:tRNA (adenosine(37)-N6)-threonylcarbamoyltransferase complex dimerization subunit type 1 TsaB [Geminicoccus roseus]